MLIAVSSRSALGVTREIPEFVREILREEFGEGKLNPGRVWLDLPVIAETGISVPITFRVDAAMSEQEHVSQIMGFAPGNPEPILADYFLGPRSGKAEVSTRIRLARTQTVVAAAKLSDNSLWATTFNITVTVGACIEDIFLHEWEMDARREARRAAARAVGR